MSVQYKSADGWKNISSSSNNAVDTVADGNMNPVTSNAVWEQSRYENAVRLNFFTESSSEAQLGQGIVIPSTYDTTDKQIEYMLNYVRDISIAKDKPLDYCGVCVIGNAPDTTSIACPRAYTFQITAVKGATNYWARGSFSSATGDATYSNVMSGITQVGVFWVYRQCERSVNFKMEASNLSITASAPTSIYTADRDGEVIVHISNSGGGFALLNVNSATVDMCGFYRPGECTLRGRVSKGDKYQVTTDIAAGSTALLIQFMGIQGISHWTNRATSW